MRHSHEFQALIRGALRDDGKHAYVCFYVKGGEQRTAMLRCKNIQVAWAEAPTRFRLAPDEIDSLVVLGPDGHNAAGSIQKTT